MEHEVEARVGRGWVVEPEVDVLDVCCAHGWLPRDVFLDDKIFFRCVEPITQAPRAPLWQSLLHEAGVSLGSPHSVGFVRKPSIKTYVFPEDR